MKKGQEKVGFNYFRVSELMLDHDLKKSEIWVYLTHCRSRGTRSRGRQVINGVVGEDKDTLYSTASITRVKDLFGSKMNNRAYSRAMRSLEDKGLIYTTEPDKVGVNMGYYRNKANEVVEIVEPKDKNSIQIPREMLDSNIFREMSSQEILTIIKLYQNYNYDREGLGSIDPDYIMAEDIETDKGYIKTGIRFGDGFNRSVYQKQVVKATDYQEIYHDEDLDLETVNNLINRKLFSFKPVIVETDPEDESLFEMKYEIFKDIVNGNNLEDYKGSYLLAEPKSDESIVWLLEPTYRVKGIEPTERYLESLSRAYERAKLIYSKADLFTQKEYRRYGLYYEGTYNHAAEEVDIETYEEIETLKRTLDNVVGSVGVIYIDLMERELKNLRGQHYQEKKSIKLENERLLREENYRSRQETSPRLKTLEREIEELEEVLEKERGTVEYLEDRLLDLIPVKAMEEFCFSGMEFYEFENVGKATRLKRREKKDK